MISFLKKTGIVLCAVSVLLILAGCGGAAEETLPPETEPVIITLPTAPPEEEAAAPTDPKDLVESLSVVLTAGELYTLEHYPNLKTVDLSGSTCYDAIVEFIANHPDLDVTYSVSLGGSEVSSMATAAILKNADYASLLENLKYLPALTSIDLPAEALSAEQAVTLRETYPNVTLNYTVELFGNTYDSGTTELDLSGMTSDQVDEAAPKLGMLTNLTNVTLSNSLSIEDVAKLQDANPNALFRYSFSLFGKTVSTADETVEYKNQAIGNEGEAEIRRALTVLDNCKRFVLDNCKLDYEVLAKIREDFRDGPKVVWRVYYGKDGRYNSLTDTDLIRAVYNVTDDTCGPMRYCEDVKYMDIGHNETLTDLSFVGYMPNIEVLIASGCAATELVGFENCKKLTWLELAYCYKLKDIECLTGCESLRFLNLSHTSVSDFMPLDGLPLERFVCLRPRASTKEQNTFISIHPKDQCITVFYGYSNPYGYGWRYDDNGKTFNEYYKTVVRKAFNYDYLEQFLPKDD